MKTLIGNGADVTILKGALNPGSSLAIESASLVDVNVYGGTLFVPGGVVLNGTVTTSGTAAIMLTGGTFGLSGSCTGSTIISSAVLGDSHAILSATDICYIGSGGAMFDLNEKSFLIRNNGRLSAYGVVFSNGSTTNSGIIRCSGGTAYLSGCSFLNNSADANAICLQQANGGYMEFNGCLFSGNSVASNYCCYMKGGNGEARFSSCVFVNNAARTATVFYAGNGGYFEARNCVATSNALTVSAGNLCQLVCPSSYLESCTFSSNSCTTTKKLVRVMLLNNIVTLSDCYIEPIISATSAAIYTSATCTLHIINGAYSTIYNLGTVNISGSASFTYINSGTVNISSGARIGLSSYISATINVGGKCYVNGKAVASGSYTKIDSTGRAT